MPNDPGTSLYIRPFLYSTDPTLALHGVHEASFVIILSPSGSYFSDGLKPVPIMVETEDVRAVRGGTAATTARPTVPASAPRPRATRRCCGSTAWSVSTSRRAVA